jgi:hypothetical protein
MHNMAPISFFAALQATHEQLILRLPDVASTRLSSRGQVAVDGKIGEHTFQAILEPDGDFGHWLKIDKRLQEATGFGPGDTITVEVEPSNDWPEPDLPRDLSEAISEASVEIRELWQAITPMARWEWVRWVNATKNPATRKRRVEVSVSKLGDGKRRPCCFNLAACTDPELSKNGKLALT